MTTQPLAINVESGDLLDGKYEVIRVIGQGGMGVVLLARHRFLNGLFALKLMAAADAPPIQVARFLREARAASKIDNPHVARVTDAGALPSGEPYLVMEYLTGRDLSRQVKDDGPLQLPEAVDYLLQAMEGIAAAHHLGIVHRDVKPANLFVSESPQGSSVVKVLDFGISKVRLGGEVTIDTLSSDPGALMGSPRYMSPEQYQKPESADVRSDVWSLGATLFEILTGEPAFQGSNVPQLYAAIAEGAVSDLTRLRPDLPNGLAAVVTRCLQRLPERRYQDVGELAEALAPFASDAGRQQVGRIRALKPEKLPASPHSAVPLVAPVVVRAPHERTLSSSESTRRHHTAWLAALGLFGLVVAAVAVLLWPKPAAKPLSQGDASRSGRLVAMPTAVGPVVPLRAPEPGPAEPAVAMTAVAQPLPRAPGNGATRMKAVAPLPGTVSPSSSATAPPPPPPSGSPSARRPSSYDTWP